MGRVMPYGAAISDAMKRGDKVEMKRVLVDAKATLKEHKTLEKAVAKLEAAIKKTPKA